MVVRFYAKLHHDMGLTESAPANFVPAAAVIRWERALSIMTGRKGFVDGFSVLYTKAQYHFGRVYKTVGPEDNKGK